MDAGNGEVECVLGACAGSACPVMSGEVSLGGLWIARSCLSQHHLGGEELVAVPLVVPPRRSEVLMGGHEQITARSCREITDEARFDINSGLCAACI